MSKAELLELALKWLLDPSVMAYMAAGAASVAVWLRSRLVGKKAMAMDVTIYAFSHVEKLWEKLPEKTKAKTTKVKKFVDAFVEAYEARTGSAPSEKVLVEAIQEAAKLALAKKMPSFFASVK